jgi:hypothetical protein
MPGELGRTGCSCLVIRDWLYAGRLGQERADNLWIRDLGFEFPSPSKTPKADVLTQYQNVDFVVSELPILPPLNTLTRQKASRDRIALRYDTGVIAAAWTLA